MLKISAVVLLVSVVAGCSMTAPVAVVAPGHVLKGEAVTSLAGGQFTVSDKTLTCTGSFNVSDSRTLSVAAKCNDGRAGIGSGVRDAADSGSGSIKMTDGTEARFIYGEQANAL